MRMWNGGCVHAAAKWSITRARARAADSSVGLEPYVAVGVVLVPGSDP